MISDYKNPYLRKTKFEHKYPYCQSLTSTSLYGPTFSTCPKKKYSTNYWHDMKSSIPELSEQVFYRMQAQYYKRQSQNYESYDNHTKSCLLNCQHHRKNPFDRLSLIDLSGAQKLSSSRRQIGYHWTDQKPKDSFIDPKMYRNTGKLGNEFADLRKKMVGGSQKKGQFSQAYYQWPYKPMLDSQKVIANTQIDNQEYEKEAKQNQNYGKIDIVEDRKFGKKKYQTLQQINVDRRMAYTFQQQQQQQRQEKIKNTQTKPHRQISLQSQQLFSNKERLVKDYENIFGKIPKEQVFGRQFTDENEDMQDRKIKRAKSNETFAKKESIEDNLRSAPQQFTYDSRQFYLISFAPTSPFKKKA